LCYFFWGGAGGGGQYYDFSLFFFVKYCQLKIIDTLKILIVLINTFVDKSTLGRKLQ
jgi:hypothetical protein